MSVGAFLAVSGWLIMASRMSTSLLDYLWRRVLRIYPGYLVCLVVVGFGFASFASHRGGGGAGSADGPSYVRANLGLQVNQHQVGHTLSDVPFPEAWNGSLWTLYYEFVCYLLVAVIVIMVPRRYLFGGTIAAFVSMTVVHLLVKAGAVAVPNDFKTLARFARSSWQGR